MLIRLPAMMPEFPAQLIAESIAEAIGLFDPSASPTCEPSFLNSPQFYDLIRSHDYPEGQTRRMMAILDDAVCCYVKYANAARRVDRKLFVEAKSWFEIDSASQSLFSFDHVCEVLGVDAGFFRTRLRRLTVGDLCSTGGRQYRFRKTVEAHLFCELSMTVESLRHPQLGDRNATRIPASRVPEFRDGPNVLIREGKRN
jgi:hypothetical protein